MSQITHMAGRQIVSPSTLRLLLRRDGDSLRRPDEFRPGDEWQTGTTSCRYCARRSSRSSHERGCPVVHSPLDGASRTE